MMPLVDPKIHFGRSGLNFNGAAVMIDSTPAVELPTSRCGATDEWCTPEAHSELVTPAPDYELSWRGQPGPYSARSLCFDRPFD